MKNDIVFVKKLKEVCNETFLIVGGDKENGYFLYFI